MNDTRAFDRLVWRTSSYSTGGQNCVEVGAAPAAWRKSSYSGATSQNCVEVAPAPAVVGIRDSKNRPAGALTVAPATWRAFVRTFTY